MDELGITDPKAQESVTKTNRELAKLEKEHGDEPAKAFLIEEQFKVVEKAWNKIRDDGLPGNESAMKSFMAINKAIEECEKLKDKASKVVPMPTSDGIVKEAEEVLAGE